MGAFTNSLISSLGDKPLSSYYYPKTSGYSIVANENYSEVFSALSTQSKSFDQKQFKFSSLSPDNPFGVPDNKKKIVEIASLKSKIYWLEKDKNAISLIVIASIAAALFTALAIVFAPAVTCLIGFSCAAGASAALTGVGAWLYVRDEQKVKSLQKQKVVPLSNEVARELLPYLIQINVVRIVTSQVMNQLHPEPMPYPNFQPISEDDTIEIVRSSTNYLNKIKADINSGKSPQEAYDAFKIDVAYI